MVAVTNIYVKKRFAISARSNVRKKVPACRTAVDRRFPIEFGDSIVKKIALFFLLALAALSLASQARNQTRPVVVFAPDVPPPSCAPDCGASQ